MKKLGGVSRHDLYERYDQPALRSLPSRVYEISEWVQVRVNLDYHVEVQKHWYSAPYQFARELLWARITPNTIELYRAGKRVASHARSSAAYKHTTDRGHMPQAHREHSAGVEGVIAWGASVGPMTEALVRRLIDASVVREQGWRSARGVQRLGEKYGPERIELACERAFRLGARSYKAVANILSHGRESLPLPDEEAAEIPIIAHENVRGAEYYH